MNKESITDHSFTFVQLANFRRYERVRASGLYNMFFLQARAATRLSREDYTFVMKNYTELKAAAEAADSED